MVRSCEMHLILCSFWVSKYSLFNSRYHKEFALHNKSPYHLKLVLLNYMISSIKRKVISTWHKEFSFPDPRKIEDSTMANKPDTALNILTNTQHIFTLPLQINSWSELPHVDDDGDIAARLPSESVVFKMTSLLFVVWQFCAMFSQCLRGKDMLFLTRSCSRVVNSAIRTLEEGIVRLMVLQFRSYLLLSY